MSPAVKLIFTLVSRVRWDFLCSALDHGTLHVKSRSYDSSLIGRDQLRFWDIDIRFWDILGVLG